VRIPRAIVQLKRAQVILVLAVLVPTVLLTISGIVLLAIGGGSVVNVVIGVLVLALTSSAITGYILVALFVGKGASLARIQNDFLSSVSHELRTPLTSIRLFLDSLRDGRLTEEEEHKVLALLGGEVERLDKLVVRVLELSRMESGRHPFERERVLVEEIAEDAIAAFDAATLSEPTEVQVDIEKGLQLIGDRATLSRAIANLLINAWKYTGKDKVITLAAHSSARHVEIVVGDNGIGISRREQLDIFEEFARGQGAIDRGSAGVGLGLAFVRAIVRAHRGKVTVASRPGGGSSFRIRLPVGRRPRPATEPAGVPVPALKDRS
jgi:two-component system, OmpR family, phosphate regulon sensor histidine kinase PhoR